jgi:hypothetical protein
VLGCVPSRLFEANLKVLIGRVIYVGGPCKAHDRLLLADPPARHLVLGGFLLYLLVAVHYWITAVRILYRGADKSLARPGRKQATVTEDFDFHVSYL